MSERPRSGPPGYMLPTHGHRDPSCARYTDCLADHALRYRRVDPPASCPAECRWRKPLAERATDYMSSGTSNWDGG